MAFVEEEDRNRKSKLRRKVTRIIPIIILLITLILTYTAYTNSYYLTEGKTELEHAISDYIPNQEVNAKIELVQKINDWMYVIYSDDRYGDCFMGMALLKRGWNGRYMIRSTQYGSGMPIHLDKNVNRSNQVIIYGLIKDGRAVRYEYAISVQDLYKEVLYKGNIDQEAFFHIQENKDYWMTRFRLFDANGIDITESYLSKQRKASPSGSVTTAELFMVDVECLMILLLGVGFAVGIRRKVRQKDKIEQQTHHISAS